MLVYLIVLLLSVEAFPLNASHIEHVRLRHGFFQTTERLLQYTQQ